MAVSSLVNQAESRAAQAASNDAQEDLMYSRYGNGYGPQGAQYDPMAGGMPSYGPQGVMPPKEGGFEEFLAHHIGMATFEGIPGTHQMVAQNGPYKGLTHGQIFEKARDDYAAMSPEQRAPWEARTFFQNDRAPGEHLYQYPSQEAKWGPDGPSYQELAHHSSMNDLVNGGQQPASTQGSGGAAPQSQDGTPSGYDPRLASQRAQMQDAARDGRRYIAPPSPAPAPAPTGSPTINYPNASGATQPAPSANFNPGSISDGDYVSPRHSSMDDLLGGDAQPSYHQRDAIPAGQIFKPVDPNLRARQSFSSLDVPQLPSGQLLSVRAGSPYDTARFGPRLTGTSLTPANNGTLPPAPASRMTTAPAPATPPGVIPHPDFQPMTMAPVAPPMAQPARSMASPSFQPDPDYANRRAMAQDNPNARYFPSQGPNPNIPPASPMPSAMINVPGASRNALMPNPAFASAGRTMDAGPSYTPDSMMAMGAGRAATQMPADSYRAQQQSAPSFRPIPAPPPALASVGR